MFTSAKLPFAGEEVEEGVSTEIALEEGRPVAESIDENSQLKGRMMLPPRAS